MVAVDQDYEPLLAPANTVPEDSDIVASADELGVPVSFGKFKWPSFLGVEIDGGLVPTSFAANVDDGDRVAVFGRWIIDCGHKIKVPAPDSGDETFRSEIHPPLVMAAARVTNENVATGTTAGSDVTRVLVTSRPFLVSSRFTTDTDRIYDDDGPDDGPFVTHMVNELNKVDSTFLGIPTESTMVEAHPKIRAHPFNGVYLVHLRVQPPAPAGHHGPPGVTAIGPHLAVSYQFTVRRGCSVQVISNTEDSVDVLISLGNVGYTSPTLPTRNEVTWTKDDLAKLGNPEAASAYTWFEVLSGVDQAINPLHGSLIGTAVVEGILSRGIKTDAYDCDSIKGTNILDRSHPVLVAASDIVAPTAPPDDSNFFVSQGLVTDDSQYFPVFGWIEAYWVKPGEVLS
jgi:hypothetical protein